MLNLSESLQERSFRNKTRLNTGPQITPRLEQFLTFIGQQGAIRFDQAQTLLARLSPQPEKMKQAGILSAERTRKFLRPWIEEGVINYRTFHYHQKGALWLSSKGLKLTPLSLRPYDPSPNTLPHLYAVNDVRLLIEARRPQDFWRSERELRAALNAHPKGSSTLHLPDAEHVSFSRSIRAIEVELHIKSEKRLEEIVYDLAANTHYNAIWYFCPDNVYFAVARVVHTLPIDARKRFTFYNLKGEAYSHESKPAAQAK